MLLRVVKLSPAGEKGRGRGIEKKRGGKGREEEEKGRGRSLNLQGGGGESQTGVCACLQVDRQIYIEGGGEKGRGWERRGDIKRENRGRREKV